MYLTRSEYDRGVNTFSPEGRLFQVEYAIEAIKLGSTAVGIQTKEGCVLAVEKRLTSTLLDPESVEKIAEIDSHIGAAMSGLVADARTLVDHARVEAQNHTFTYDEPIGVEALTQGQSLHFSIILVFIPCRCQGLITVGDCHQFYCRCIYRCGDWCV
jgi:20S proteasome subunit alpha 5